MKSALLGSTIDELTDLVTGQGAAAYRARQIAEWLYGHHARDWDQMSNLPANLRARLAADYVLGRFEPVRALVSADGTRKYLFPAGEGRSIETAVIPDRDRHTLCMSTQAGCRRACRFCFTAKGAYQGDLEPWAIVNQYASCPERDAVTNIVFMGMGEPFDNPDALFKALEIFTADYGYAMSPTRLTVSTVGVIPGIKRYLRDSRSHLAISVNSPFPHERLKLMPAEKIYPLREVVGLLSGHDWSGQRRLTFEYIMFAGLNDTERHADALAELVGSIECRVNLIAFNEGPGIDFRASDQPAIEAFQSRLRMNGVRTTIRKSKGQDIAAACGQLSGSAL